MKNLYIVGAGGCGREILNTILDIHAIQGPRWNIRGFLDDTDDPLKDKPCDYGVVGSIVDYRPEADDLLVMGIADPAAKRRLGAMLAGRGAVFETIIHPYTALGRHNSIGTGSVLFAGFSMTVNVTLGRFVTIIGSGLGHDVTIEDFATISGACNIMGKVTVEEEVFIGGNVAVAPGTTIGSRAYVCMGSMVMKDVQPGTKVMGNPAREIG
ncbi:Sialic acid O-acetyltransferase NeuD family sugar O-acyltransferase [uncultured delta proteobacterium]|uniref:Sialic acid O-acetyltransferase NeuD family sugar O-acyltransferase n=1 Tax=uncultured delta proteobacterium TaxID=34034 RepID=A0A212JWF5_9DELT|nr:Sialic acid O-acetyltransferase NeuD family sugar O-acyltransferase [uncultured delta proteobacterium]